MSRYRAKGLNVCQQDPTVFVSREGRAEQQRRAAGSQIFKNVANFGYTLDTKLSELVYEEIKSRFNSKYVCRH